MGYFKVVNRENIDINAEIEKYGTTRVLISDGIRIDRGILKYSVKIQRVLTPYQLEKIIAENSMERYIIIISSFIFDSWSLNVLDDLYTVIDKSVCNGSTVILEIVGTETVNGNIMV
jgi:hypothetical protein